MTKEELRQEMLEDDAREVRRELEEEHKMRSDYDYAFEKLNISEDMTIHELIEASNTLKNLGWDVDICELIDTI